MRRIALGIVAAMLSACSTAQPSPPTTSPGSVPAATTGEPSQPPSGSPSVPVVATSQPSQPTPSEPAMTFDPGALGSPGPAPTIAAQGKEAADGVTTEDISFSTADVPPTAAYLVRPTHAGKRPAPAIVWFHWLETGDSTSSRTEFLDEAQGLAARGVVSLLVQGTFPWHDAPVSLEHDRTAVEAEVRMLRAGLDLLDARPDVDPVHVAVVGHDFGAMYASILFGSDPRVSALVMMAPTARWADWFLRYWAVAGPSSAYLAAMAPLDPVTWLPDAGGRPILLQLATHDPYVPAGVARQLTDAAGASGETRTYDAGHELDATARADRDAWLAQQLGLP
jgi:dienelactone hydrolase